MDTGRLERVYHEEATRIRAALAARLGDVGLAEDAVQDAFIEAIEHWRDGQIPANSGGWLATTARRKAIDRLRRARVGFTRAAELAMLGERLDAPTALHWGLINRVWPDAEFASQADALLDRLASGATQSYAGTKRQLNHWMYERMAAQLEFEAGIQRELAASGDFAEGVAAFVAKRPPRFSGA